MSDLNCRCGQNIIKSGDTEAKLRCKIVKWDRGGMKAVCKACDFEVPISIELMKSIQSSFVYEVEPDKRNSVLA